MSDLFGNTTHWTDPGAVVEESAKLDLARGHLALSVMQAKTQADQFQQDMALKFKEFGAREETRKLQNQIRESQLDDQSTFARALGELATAKSPEDAAALQNKYSFKTKQMSDAWESAISKNNLFTQFTKDRNEFNNDMAKIDNFGRAAVREYWDGNGLPSHQALMEMDVQKERVTKAADATKVQVSQQQKDMVGFYEIKAREAETVGDPSLAAIYRAQGKAQTESHLTPLGRLYAERDAARTAGNTELIAAYDRQIAKDTNKIGEADKAALSSLHADARSLNMRLLKLMPDAESDDEATKKKAQRESTLIVNKLSAKNKQIMAIEQKYAPASTPSARTSPDSQEQVLPFPNSADEAETGKLYQGKSGPRRWTGTGWVAP